MLDTFSKVIVQFNKVILRIKELLYFKAQNQNLFTPIFDKTIYRHFRNTNHMVHILSNSCTARPIRAPSKCM